MKQGIIFVLLILTISCLCSWTIFLHNKYNKSTWTIRIGKTELLSSKKDKLGDSAYVNLNMFKKDTLFVEKYTCLFGGGTVSVLTILNEESKVISTTTNTNSSLGYSASIPIKDIINSNEFNNAKTISIYFSILRTKEDNNENVLLGKLKLRQI